TIGSIEIYTMSNFTVAHQVLGFVVRRPYVQVFALRSSFRRRLMKAVAAASFTMMTIIANKEVQVAPKISNSNERRQSPL
ncbi:hypothetical protein, partial [Secundilactobacillus similis]|uniref:hypothetical protein n=1 Tax=Secundilactobacillus similis TaxID=414682 RepID=UPI000ABC9578